MKLKTHLFEEPARVLKEETVDDAIREILSNKSEEDAFMVLDIGDIVHKIKNWKLKMPRIKPFYAVKCNTDKTVLQVLAAMGTGFDCASKAEMQKIINLGVSPSRIIYAHTCKPESHIVKAASLGVHTMTFDNSVELHKIKAIHPNARLLLRIRCDAAAAQCPLGIKFGANPKSIPILLSTAKSLGLNVVGVSFHVGSGCQESEVFLRAIRKARQTFDEAIAMGFKPYLLDIGGGYPGGTGTSLDDIAAFVNQGLEECFPDESVQVIAEPGRYVVASAFTLVTKVTSIRPYFETEGEKRSFMYYVNDGVYGSFNCILYDHQEVHPEVIFTEDKTGAPRFPSSIWGPTCDSIDQIIPEIELPELELGQWIKWKDMGAYTIAASQAAFNGFPRPSVRSVIPFHTWLVLKELEAERALNRDKELGQIEAPFDSSQDLLDRLTPKLGSLTIEEDQEQHPRE